MCISFVSFFPAKFPVTVQLERKRCPNVTTDVFFPFPYFIWPSNVDQENADPYYICF